MASLDWVRRSFRFNVRGRPHIDDLYLYHRGAWLTMLARSGVYTDAISTIVFLKALVAGRCLLLSCWVERVTVGDCWVRAAGLGDTFAW